MISFITCPWSILTVIYSSTTDSLDVPNEEGEEAGENDEHYEEDVQALNEFETLLESKSMGDISGTKTGLVRSICKILSITDYEVDW